MIPIKHKTIFRLRSRRVLGVLAAFFLLAGCMHDDKDPSAKFDPAQIRLADDIHLARDGWPAAFWWTRYDDPQLNALIARAIVSAPSIAVAQTRIAQSHAQVKIIGNWWNNFQIMGGGIFTKDLQAGDILINYNLDIWGKQSHAVEAAIGAENASVAEAAAVELEISTEVAQLYYGIQTNYHLIDLIDKSSEVWKLAIQAQEARAETGLGSRVNIAQPRVQLLALERQKVAALGEIKNIREAIRALVGATADDLPEIKPVPLPRSVEAALPETLSYELLARRPDLQAMRWYVQSTLSEIEATKAAFYPSINLAGLFLFGKVEVGNLFSKSTTQVMGLPLIYLPIFQIDQLNAALDSARASRNQLIERYNQAVFNAVREVAVCGNKIQTLQAEHQLQLDKIKDVNRSHEAAEAAYQRGLGNRIQAAEARLPGYLAQTELLLLESQLVSLDINLIKALGGGYRAENAEHDPNSSDNTSSSGAEVTGK
ncbi:MAG: TolC family protein [Puniceicoccales bacterium]|jgi:multidrug efflux system outer membrane protein|nr:TolC family protein [Puniceicoccales bacterium]